MAGARPHPFLLSCRVGVPFIRSRSAGALAGRMEHLVS
jgi:hypothetical protein